MTMRERILEKANELFTRYGIKRVTMDEIALRLGISKKTIYQSFADKNELVSEIFDKHICFSRQNCMANLEKSENAVHEVLLGSETFCSIMQTINANVLYDLEKYHPEIFEKFIQFKNQFLHTCIYQNLKRGIAERLYRKEINIEIITRLRLANIVLAMNIELFPQHQFRFSETENEIVTHFLCGIVTEKGAAIMKKYANLLSKEHEVLN